MQAMTTWQLRAKNLQPLFYVIVIVTLSLMLYALHVAKRSRVIYVSVLGGTISLPNDFVLQTGVGEGAEWKEVTLRGNKGLVVIGHNLEGRGDFLEYVGKNLKGTEDTCGLTTRRVEDASSKSRMVVISDKRDYVVFADVPVETFDAATRALCRSIKPKT